MFSTRLESCLPVSSNLNCRLQPLSVWKSPKFVVRERFNWASMSRWLWTILLASFGKGRSKRHLHEALHHACHHNKRAKMALDRSSEYFRGPKPYIFFLSLRDEEFWRISLCPYRENSPHSPEPCSLTDQSFANSFEKGHPRNILVKLFQNLTWGFRKKEFLRISSCPYSEVTPIHQSHVNWRTKFHKHFWERSPKAHFFKII